MLCYAMLCCAMPCHAMLCYAMLCYAMLCYAMLCYAMLCYAMLCYAMLCYAMLCYAMLCYVMLCCAMLCFGAVICGHLPVLQPLSRLPACQPQQSAQHKFDRFCLACTANYPVVRLILDTSKQVQLHEAMQRQNYAVHPEACMKGMRFCCTS